MPADHGETAADGAEATLAIETIAERLHADDNAGWWWGPGAKWRTLDEAGKAKYRARARRILHALGEKRLSVIDLGDPVTAEDLQRAIRSERLGEDGEQ